MPIISPQFVVYKILTVLIDLEQEIILLKVARGFMDGTIFVKLSEEEIPINQTDTATLSNIVCNKNKTMYESIKEALYNYLIDNGKISGKIV